MSRVPWADRAEVIARHCTCERDDEGEIAKGCIETRDDAGRLTSRTWYRLTDPECKLHGRDAEPSPY